jgi:hypothetical protein
MSWQSLAFVLGVAVTAADVAHCHQTGESSIEMHNADIKQRKAAPEGGANGPRHPEYASHEPHDGAHEDAGPGTAKRALEGDTKVKPLGSVSVVERKETERTSIDYPPQSEREVRTKAREGERLWWGAGIRAQTTYSEGTWLQLGVDAVIYPHNAVGVGITALQGRSLRGAACESAGGERCGPYWRTLVPFVEMRVLPLAWISPYVRGSAGMAWGQFHDAPSRALTAALATRSELGLDFHRSVSVRLYITYERFDGGQVSVGGLGGGMQLGLTL